VREHVRETLEKEPQILHSTNEMFDCIKSKLEIGRNDWIRNSVILRNLISQKRINEYARIA
jgi:hypothetical protein